MPSLVRPQHLVKWAQTGLAAMRRDLVAPKGQVCGRSELSLRLRECHRMISLLAEVIVDGSRHKKEREQ